MQLNLLPKWSLLKMQLSNRRTIIYKSLSGQAFDLMPVRILIMQKMTPFQYLRHQGGTLAEQ